MGLLTALGRIGRSGAGRPLPANNPLIQRGMQMMERRIGADDAHRAFSGGMFGELPGAMQSKNGQALAQLQQRMMARGAEYGGGDVEQIKSLLYYTIPGLRNNPRLQSAKSLEELGALLDESGADPAQWAGRIGI